MSQSVSKFALYFNVSSVLDPWMHFPEKHSRNRFDSHNSAKSIFLVLCKGMKHVGPMVLLLMLISRETVANSIHECSDDHEPASLSHFPLPGFSPLQI
ncbi:hypothetical protein LWI28_009840 [Acer negundo]|uniref:Uncharacterized protein n=1 Tax=Acer negundo TaxID=4023 RepID=A0AAD5J552_ACENE|nr:hypothetical protein LWI28_009840 [Acer negundo]